MNGDTLQTYVDHLEPVSESLGVAPCRQSLERLHATWERVPAWVTQGHMPMLDAVVVHEFVRATTPRRVVEIGTASGVSICAVALALEAAGALRDAQIHTYDGDTRCYFDRDRRTGEAIAEMLPALADTIAVHRGENTINAARQHPARSIDLAIIDGDHRHPYPMIDLALLAPALAPGAWVLLHDINLPSFTFRDPVSGADMTFPHTGAEKLYRAWPGVTVEPAPGAYVNIGAIRVPDEGLTAEQVAAILDPTPLDEGVDAGHASEWIEHAKLPATPTRP